MIMAKEIEFDLEVDASGLKCPLPILRAKKGLSQIQSGQVVKVVTTDPHAKEDFQAFSAQTGNELLVQQPSNDSLHHYLKKR